MSKSSVSGNFLMIIFSFSESWRDCCLNPFFEWGFNLPSSDFIHGILYFYSTTLNHLNPSSTTHISIFVHLFESFVGAPPSLTLFKYLFHLKPQPNKPALTVIGEAGFQLRATVKKDYLKLSIFLERRINPFSSKLIFGSSIPVSASYLTWIF